METVKITEEQFNDWLSNPVTEYLMDEFRVQKEIYENRAYNSVGVDDSLALKSKVAAETLNIILDVEYA